jgi:hypothetical protein
MLGLAFSACILVLGALSAHAERFQHSLRSQDKAISSLSASMKGRRSLSPVEIKEEVHQWCAVGEKPCFRNPTVWGPPTWFFLHSLTLALPKEVPPDEQAKIKSLMESLPDLLPCPSCGVNLKEHMKEEPIEPNLASRDKMVTWMLHIHNRVNNLLGKRAWTEQEMRAEYEEAFSSNGNYAAVLGGKPARSGAVPAGQIALMAFGCLLSQMF